MLGSFPCLYHMISPLNKITDKPSSPCRTSPKTAERDQSHSRVRTSVLQRYDPELFRAGPMEGSVPHCCPSWLQERIQRTAHCTLHIWQAWRWVPVVKPYQCHKKGHLDTSCQLCFLPPTQGHMHHKLSHQWICMFLQLRLHETKMLHSEHRIMNQ